MHWALIIQMFKLEVLYKKGSENIIADVIVLDFDMIKFGFLFLCGIEDSDLVYVG